MLQAIIAFFAFLNRPINMIDLIDKPFEFSPICTETAGLRLR